MQTDPEVRDGLARWLYERGIYTTYRYPTLHRVAAYRAGDVELPGAERAAARTLCLPLHQALTDDDVDQVVEGVRTYLEPRRRRDAAS